VKDDALSIAMLLAAFKIKAAVPSVGGRRRAPSLPNVSELKLAVCSRTPEISVIFFGGFLSAECILNQSGIKLKAFLKNACNFTLKLL
jgi:hypothetical protein